MRGHREANTNIMTMKLLTFQRSFHILGKSNPNVSLSFQGSVRNNSNLVKCDFVNADKNVAILTLNDPDRLNALTESMGDQLGARVNDLKQVRRSNL